MRLAPVLLVALVGLAGCLGGVAPATPAGPTDAGATPAPGTVHPDTGPTERATVVRVVDGDTVEVRLADGSEETVRLLGVDTPEVFSENTPDEYEGVPETGAGRSCLGRAGERASTFAERELAGREVGLGYDPREERRGYYGRLLAYVYVDGEQFNGRLVGEGHARVFDSRVVERERYTRIETDARSARRGLWACVDGTAAATPDATPVADGGTPLSVTVTADAPGDDRENLDGETVRLRNEGEEPLDVSGWTLTDEAGHRYRFPPGATVAPGEAAVVHTGSGTDGDGHYYWGRGSPVWNNDGDTATVRDDDGRVVARATY